MDGKGGQLRVPGTGGGGPGLLDARRRACEWDGGSEHTIQRANPELAYYVGLWYNLM